MNKAPTGDNLAGEAGSPTSDAAAVAASYDAVAIEYARRVFGELADKPFDRQLLDAFAISVGSGRVLDIGCGPGHVARYLHERGCTVAGVDVSPRMIETARELNPQLEFTVGDLRALEIADDSVAAVVAFYSLIHLHLDQLKDALDELHRVLRPGGQLLLAVHEGDEIRRPGEMWGIPVTLEFCFFTRDQIVPALHAAHFSPVMIEHRPPYPGVEAATNRLYVRATAEGATAEENG